jgi:hypothetical protein
MDDSFEQIAISVMLSKLIIAQDASEITKQWKEKAERDWLDAEKARMQCRRAFNVFGFDDTDPKVWDKVKDKIGELAYVDAIKRARLPKAVEPPPTAETTEIDQEEDFSGAEEPSSEDAPRVREMALTRLQTIGSSGAKAAEIREYIEKTYKRSLHEKTVGMTLYRLSQEDPPKVHRKGHTWFFGPSQDEQKNPGGDTPGDMSVFD